MFSEEFHGCDPESYHHLEKSIGKTLNTLQPKENISAVGLACTSMSFSLGTEKTNNMMSSILPKAHITNMASALNKALKTMGIKRITLLVPYIFQLSMLSHDYFTKLGYQIVSFKYLDLHHDVDIERLNPDFILDQVKEMEYQEEENLEPSKRSQAIVLCCSAMRVTNEGFIDKMEKICNKPVLTSTQSFIWDLLRLSKVNDKILGYGELFAKY